MGDFSGLAEKDLDECFREACSFKAAALFFLCSPTINSFSVLLFAHLSLGIGWNLEAIQVRSLKTGYLS